MTKKSTKPVAKQEPAKKDAAKKDAEERSAGLDPFGRLHLSEWFERWPEIFARRWPESLEGVPFLESGFRMEQFLEDGTLVVRSELPGLDPDRDLKITIDDDVLTIAGEREERSKKEVEGGYRSEFHYGSFSRAVRLPAGAQVDRVSAGYTDGILEVRVPIDAEAKDVVNVPIHRPD